MRTDICIEELYYNVIYYENEFESELKTRFADTARLR